MIDDGDGLVPDDPWGAERREMCKELWLRVVALRMAIDTSWRDASAEEITAIGVYYAATAGLCVDGWAEVEQ